MKRTISILIIIITFFVQLEAQKSLLQSGPMTGYSTMREVQIWAQTNEEAEVQILYWEEDEPLNIYESDFVSTFKVDAFTAHITIEDLEPGKKYNYELYINDEKILLPYKLKFQTQELWQWRKDAPDFRFTAGSCFYVNEDPYDRPGQAYGGGFQIFNNKKQSRFYAVAWR